MPALDVSPNCKKVSGSSSRVKGFLKGDKGRTDPRDDGGGGGCSGTASRSRLWHGSFTESIDCMSCRIKDRRDSGRRAYTVQPESSEATFVPSSRNTGVACARSPSCRNEGISQATSAVSTQPIYALFESTELSLSRALAWSPMSSFVSFAFLQGDRSRAPICTTESIPLGRRRPRSHVFARPCTKSSLCRTFAVSFLLPPWAKSARIPPRAGSLINPGDCPRLHPRSARLTHHLASAQAILGHVSLSKVQIGSYLKPETLSRGGEAELPCSRCRNRNRGIGNLCATQK